MIQIFGILVIITIGFLVVNLFLSENSLGEKIGLSFPAGIGIFTFVLFLLNWGGILLRSPDSYLIAFGLAAGLLILNMVFRKSIPSLNALKNLFSFRDSTKKEKLLFVLLGILIVSSLMPAIYWPVIHWDALELYDFRAKTFLATGSMADGLLRGNFIGYPLLTSLAHYWFYLVSFSTPMIVYWLFLISFLITFYFLCRKFLNKNGSLIFTFLLSICPLVYDHSRTAYTNLPYTVYFVLGSIYLFFWSKSLNNKVLGLSALLIGLSTWTRSSEPFWLVPLGLAAILLIKKKKIRSLLVYLTIFLGIYIPWIIFQRTNTEVLFGMMVPAQYAQTLLSADSLGLLFPVINYLKWSFVEYYLLYFVLFLLSSILIIKKGSGNRLLLLLISGSLVMLFLGTWYMAITLPQWREIPDSLRRMMMFWPPLVIFLTVTVISDFYNREAN